jgi:hypothetical protein
MRVDVFPSMMSIRRGAVIHNNGFRRISQVPFDAVIAHNMAYFGGIQGPIVERHAVRGTRVLGPGSHFIRNPATVLIRQSVR